MQKLRRILVYCLVAAGFFPSSGIVVAQDNSAAAATSRARWELRRQSEEYWRQRYGNGAAAGETTGAAQGQAAQRKMEETAKERARAGVKSRSTSAELAAKAKSDAEREQRIARIQQELDARRAAANGEVVAAKSAPAATVPPAPAPLADTTATSSAGQPARPIGKSDADALQKAQEVLRRSQAQMARDHSRETAGVPQPQPVANAMTTRQRVEADRAMDEAAKREYLAKYHAQKEVMRITNGSVAPLPVASLRPASVSSDTAPVVKAKSKPAPAVVAVAAPVVATAPLSKDADRSSTEVRTAVARNEKPAAKKTRSESQPSNRSGNGATSGTASVRPMLVRTPGLTPDEERKARELLRQTMADLESQNSTGSASGSTAVAGSTGAPSSREARRARREAEAKVRAEAKSREAQARAEAKMQRERANQAEAAALQARAQQIKAPAPAPAPKPAPAAAEATSVAVEEARRRESASKSSATSPVIHNSAQPASLVPAASSGPATKKQRLAELLREYTRNDSPITAKQYHEQRSKILSEPGE